MDDLIALASLCHNFFQKEASNTKSPYNQRHKKYSNMGKNRSAEPVATQNIICYFHKNQKNLCLRHSYSKSLTIISLLQSKQIVRKVVFNKKNYNYRATQIILCTSL